MSASLAGGTSPNQTVPPALFDTPTTVLARLRVFGIPTPAGSKVAFVDRHSGQARLKEQNAGAHQAWSQAVASIAHDHSGGCGLPPFDGAMVLEATFRFPVPKIRRRLAERSGGTLPKVSAPDTSKLVRSIEDAMQSGGLIVNDARFTTVFASKIEVLDGWTGCDITIRRAT